MSRGVSSTGEGLKGKLEAEERVSGGVSPPPFKALGQEGGAPSRSSGSERVGYT